MCFRKDSARCFFDLADRQTDNLCLQDSSLREREYPLLLIDPFEQCDQWMEKYYNLQKIHLDDPSKHDVVMSIEQSFLFGSKIYIKNCNTLDSLLYPLAQWKATSHESNSNDGISTFFFVSYLNLKYLFKFKFNTLLTCDSLDKISSSLALLTTSINCQYSVETSLDDLRQQILQCIQPNLYYKKLSIFRLILLCQLRIQAIDSFLKSNAVSDEFDGDRVILTSVALERKYLFGGIVDEANEIFDTIESYHDYYFPY
ncbi:unnamed protein product, partial [Adineta steineri]